MTYAYPIGAFITGSLIGAFMAHYSQLKLIETLDEVIGGLRKLVIRENDKLNALRRNAWVRNELGRLVRYSEASPAKRAEVERNQSQGPGGANNPAR